MYRAVASASCGVNDRNDAGNGRFPLHAMTTYELRDYRHDLEQAIAFFDRQAPVPPASAQLRARLDAVLAEQDERARLARA
jgi:hypothetical protein